jgi:hypothetical protein
VDWPEHVRKYVADNCHIVKDEHLAARLTLLLGRPVSVDDVRRVRRGMGIEKEHGHGVCRVRRRADRPAGGGAAP